MSRFTNHGLSFDDRGALGISGAIGLRAGGAPARVGVVFGGPSPEHDVSILTGLQVGRGLRSAPNIGEIHVLYWTKAGEFYEVENGLEAAAYLEGPPAGAAPLRLVAGPSGGFFTRGSGRFGAGAKEQQVELDAVIVACHGGPGEDGTLQGMLDLCGIPYSGPHLAGALIGMDKLAFSALMASAWLQMLPRVPLVAGATGPSFPGPYIVKPRFGGSSIGVEVVSDHASALARLRVNHHLKRGAVLEPYQPELFDLQVAVRMWPEVQLSAIERPLRTTAEAEILAYKDKYVGPEGMTTAPRELPAQIPSELERQIRTVAPEVATLCGVRGIARIDFLSDGDALYVNEINTIPGSLARYLWIEPPVAFPALLLELLGEAIARPSASYSTTGADGSVLRGAGSIGGKLA
ncbi:MAG: D-alanine--D-alanine ligase family protein [Acidimicrobiales bacterium]